MCGLACLIKDIPYNPLLYISFILTVTFPAQSVLIVIAMFVLSKQIAHFKHY